MASSKDMRLFWASFLTLIAAGIGFSMRGATLLSAWSNRFGFTQTELGQITGGGLVGFGITIIALSFVADRIGYGPLMLLAFILHVSSAVVTLAATPVYDALGKEACFQCLYWGMFLFALGNGTCEAVINPLTATLFPDNKTHWLNILHAGWPGGLVLGALLGLLFDSGALGTVSWEIQLSTFLVPVALYGLLMVGQPFPKSEAVASGVTGKDMLKELGLLGASVVVALLGLWLSGVLANMGLPALLGWGAAVLMLLIFGFLSEFALGHWMMAMLLVLHALVGYVELGTDSWIQLITGNILDSKTGGMMLFIWTSSLMFGLRFFAGPIVHRISPLGLLFVSAVLGCAGLIFLGNAYGILACVLAATVYGFGKTFLWPTMLGVVSERFPRGGAITLGMIGGVGMLSAGLL
ncbi:MAG: sugar MFS transporter, partial [Gemmataceae bacterium]